MRHMTTMMQFPARKEIRPGMLLRVQVVKVMGRRGHTENWVTPHDVRGGSVSNRYPMFALPRDDAGREPLEPYAPGEQCQVVVAVDTDVQVLLAGGEQVFSGSPLVSAGDGTLVHCCKVPSASQIIATASEDIDLTDLPARLIKAKTRT